jgi:hypothetical protein
MVSTFTKSSGNAACKIRKANGSWPAAHTEWQIANFWKEECMLMGNVFNHNELTQMLTHRQYNGMGINKEETNNVSASRLKNSLLMYISWGSWHLKRQPCGWEALQSCLIPNIKPASATGGALVETEGVVKTMIEASYAELSAARRWVTKIMPPTASIHRVDVNKQLWMCQQYSKP